MITRKTVHVTDDHILHNNPGECLNCAVAQALNESLGGEWLVTEAAARDREGMGQRHIRLPPFVTQMIRSLDRREDVGAFSFEAEILEPDTN